MVLASDYDKSKYLCAEDLKSERKFRIKAVTVEAVGTEVRRRRSLSFGSPTISAALFSTRPTTAPCGVRLATKSAVGRTRSSSCFPRWLICEEKWLVACVSAFRRRKEATAKLWQHHRNRRRRRRQRSSSLMSLVKRNRRRSRASPTISTMKSGSRSGTERRAWKSKPSKPAISRASPCRATANQ